MGRKEGLAKLRQQGDAVAAKLLSLLNLPCDVVLVPTDLEAGAITLVDPSVPLPKLIEQALATGPTIQETRDLLATLQAAHAKAECWLILPTKSTKLQLALNRNREMQVQLSLQEIAAKLTAGVQEAYNTIVVGREQLALIKDQIQHTEESYRLSELRVRENAPGARPTDVMQAIRGLEQAHHEHLSALNTHNKAQVRLLLLLGPAPEKGPLPPTH
jgi:hypothetical protein